MAFMSMFSGVYIFWVGPKLGVLLKQARIDAGMTQEQIARQLKTSKSVISRMENHATDIRLSTLEKFAKAVGRDIRVALV